jgi:non-ribosomal peptide synthetase component F
MNKIYFQKPLWESFHTSRDNIAIEYGANYYIKKDDINRERIPIGKPMKGSRLILFDKDMKICDRGFIGEIYIRTPYRTYGYYNDPGLNQDKFIKNPMGTDPEDLLFKTGDLGIELPDGNFEFLGRIDRQVKIRGIRVEFVCIYCFKWKIGCLPIEKIPV